MTWGAFVAARYAKIRKFAAIKYKYFYKTMTYLR